MIAAWMLWSIGVGLLLLVAGLAAEKVLEGRRRWVWAVAGVAAVLLMTGRVLTSGGAETGTVAGTLAIPQASATGVTVMSGAEGTDGGGGTLASTPSTAFPQLTVPHDSTLHTLDRILLPAWLAVSAVLGLWALVGAAGFRRRRRFWKPGRLLGHPVLWSRRTGPAIVGLLRPRVVVPSWVNEVERSQQELILAHEEEHGRAGDGVLRFAMATLLVAFPWNPFLWLHHRRLCLAIELDCDHRVMRRLPDSRWHYGDLLVRVGSRGGLRPGFAPTAFAERRSFLERRIGKLLSEAPEVSTARVAFFAFAAVLVAGVALWVPGVTREADQPADAAPFEPGSPVHEHTSSHEPESPVHEHTSSEAGAKLDWLFHPTPGRILHGTLVMTPSPHVSFVFSEEAGAPAEIPPLPVVTLPNATSPHTAAYDVPPVAADASVMEAPRYVYHTLAPKLANRWHVRRMLEDGYPADLRDAGIGGTAVVYVFVNTDGTVSEAVVKTGSGHASLDRVAVRAAKSARFLPASNEGIPVGIWIEMEMPFVVNPADLP